MTARVFSNWSGLTACVIFAVYGMARTSMMAVLEEERPFCWFSKLVLLLQLFSGRFLC